MLSSVHVPHLEKVCWAGDTDSHFSSVTGKPVNFHEIKAEFNAFNLFQDADFPPTDESHGQLDGGTAAGAAGKTESRIHWVRRTRTASRTELRSRTLS